MLRSRRGILGIAVGAALIGVGLAAVPAMAVGHPAADSAATGYVPAQFIAKQYTEGLGRIPDQPGWQSAVSYFQQNGCSASTLAAYGEAVMTSPEEQNLGYGDGARLLTLYRAAINREPDAATYDSWLQQLQSGTSWAQLVKTFYTGSEIAALVPKICSGAVDSSATSYYWGTQAPLAIPTTGSGFTGTEAQLQALLDSTPHGGSVALAQGAVVPLTEPLSIPDNVTLTTTGSPDTRHYADMGRLVRASSFTAPAKLEGMVQPQQGARLDNVWVDGGRDTPDDTAPLTDVMTYGTGISVNDDELSNTQAPNTLYLLGGYDGYPCSAMSAMGNLITAYSSDHYRSNDWTDGISDNCENATIQQNQVVDASDVGIVVYRNTTSTPQDSEVYDNQVLSAGNSAYGGLGFDPLYETSGTATQTFPFTGASIKNNTLWSGPNSHFDIGITDGSRAWFAGTYPADSGTGGGIFDNTTGSQSARVQIGIADNGMLQTEIQDNSLTTTLITSGNCPKLAFAAELSGGHASGDFDPQPTDVNIDGCV